MIACSFCRCKCIELRYACACLQDHRELFDLKDPSWKQDIVPEIWDGHNILDFVDPDIDARLAEIEREEEELEKQHAQVRSCEGYLPVHVARAVLCMLCILSALAYSLWCGVSSSERRSVVVSGCSRYTYRSGPYYQP